MCGRGRLFVGCSCRLTTRLPLSSPAEGLVVDFCIFGRVLEGEKDVDEEVVAVARSFYLPRSLFEGELEYMCYLFYSDIRPLEQHTLCRMLLTSLRVPVIQLNSRMPQREGIPHWTDVPAGNAQSTGEVRSCIRDLDVSFIKSIVRTILIIVDLPAQARLW